MLTPEERARKGGQARAANAAIYCSQCGQMLPQWARKDMGLESPIDWMASAGGKARASRHTHEELSAWGKMGGRGKKKGQSGNSAGERPGDTRKT